MLYTALSLSSSFSLCCGPTPRRRRPFVLASVLLRVAIRAPHAIAAAAAASTAAARVLVRGAVRPPFGARAMALVAAIDQGTSSSRVIVFDTDGAVVTSAQVELPLITPQQGCVFESAGRRWRREGRQLGLIRGRGRGRAYARRGAYIRWVEQDPTQILTTVQTCMQQAAAQLEHKGYVPKRDIKGPTPGQGQGQGLGQGPGQGPRQGPG